MGHSISSPRCAALLAAALACSSPPAVKTPAGGGITSPDAGPSTEEEPPDAASVREPELISNYELREIAGVSHVVTTPGDVDLGVATSYRVVGQIDLCGQVPLTRGGRLVQEPLGRPALPIELVSLRHEGDDGGWSTALVLVSHDPAPRILFRTEVASGLAGGGGISADWELVAPESPGQPLRVKVAGEALPAPGDEPMRPGPPQIFYQKVEGVTCP